jgi:uncharacterized small protein (DUF1192 family)
MKNYDELIAKLAQGASISRERNMNLDFAKVADNAADAIQELQAECGRLSADFKRQEVYSDELQDRVNALTKERDEYRKESSNNTLT